MVIFGAGASYDSLARYPPDGNNIPGTVVLWRPPLANQLFDARFGQYIQQFRQMHAVVPDLENPAGGVEAVLEEFQNEAAKYPRRLNQLAAVRYYLQSMLSNCQTNWNNVAREVTNYKALLGRIDQRVQGPKLLVSFNYDTLLEEALESTVDVKIDGMSRYLSSDYLVVKLHGSINWAHKILAPEIQQNAVDTEVASRVIDKAQQLDISPEFDLISRSQLARSNSGAIIPALSIPVANKSVYECPKEQQQVLTDLLPTVDKVLMIGWKGGEARFLELLAQRMNKQARILVISSSEAKASELIIKLSKSLRIGVANYFFAGKGGFSRSITSHEADEFLRSL